MFSKSATSLNYTQTSNPTHWKHKSTFKSNFPLKSDHKSCFLISHTQHWFMFGGIPFYLHCAWFVGLRLFMFFPRIINWINFHDYITFLAFSLWDFLEFIFWIGLCFFFTFIGTIQVLYSREYLLTTASFFVLLFEDSLFFALKQYYWLVYCWLGDFSLRIPWDRFLCWIILLLMELLKFTIIEQSFKKNHHILFYYLKIPPLQQNRSNCWLLCCWQHSL